MTQNKKRGLSFFETKSYNLWRYYHVKIGICPLYFDSVLYTYFKDAKYFVILTWHLHEFSDTFRNICPVLDKLVLLL